jgi:aminopeptidase N
LSDKKITSDSNILIYSSDETITTHFEPTPKMSSYLLAFVVSDLKEISNEDTMSPRSTLHRVWVRPDAVDKAQYALNNSIAALDALEKFFGYIYELEKVDSAGIPNKGGAMENWGRKKIAKSLHK